MRLVNIGADCGVGCCGWYFPCVLCGGAVCRFIFSIKFSFRSVDCGLLTSSKYADCSEGFSAWCCCVAVSAITPTTFLYRALFGRGYVCRDYLLHPTSDWAWAKS